MPYKQSHREFGVVESGQSVMVSGPPGARGKGMVGKTGQTLVAATQRSALTDQECNGIL